ncbi:hypothetical protein WQQ_37390 [Hydrocarboniphaga effusa AP103]|uniref:Uncharacterized protein n=1 Tax=Hydrocarboniphaga effusa AP103 TaxID=1172194 RepID=I7Z9P7_9GAMM|nr:hypothetical protein WQQ_37390 [Hydrocarboniphaga effusa AP103]
MTGLAAQADKAMAVRQMAIENRRARDACMANRSTEANKP